MGIKTGSERKYRILSEVQSKGIIISFDVLYYAKSESSWKIDNEIGMKEGKFIRQYQPILNYQIPKEEDWRKWDINKIKTEDILEELL